VVPIKWIAVVLRELDFSMTVYDLDPAIPERMREVTRRLSESLGAHRDGGVTE
jgi:hypothetical protein